MEKITSKMDSVFDSVADSVTDFDVMFDEDDHLVDVVEGFAANGKPLTGDEFEDIHLSDDEKGDLDSTRDLDDDATPDDIRKTLSDRDDLFGSSLKDVENGSEWDIDNNNKYFKNEEKDKAEKWFEDSDKEYQNSDFHGSVDPEDINKSLIAQREAMAYLESDEEDKKAVDDATDVSDEEVKEAAFDRKELDDIPKAFRPNSKERFSFGEDGNEDKEEDDSEAVDDATDVSEEEALEAAMNFLESSDEDDSIVHDDIDSTTDIMNKKPGDHYDIEDEDDPVLRDDDTETDDGVGELESAMSFLEADEGKKVKLSDDTKKALEDKINNSKNTITFDELDKKANKEDSLKEAMAFLEEDEGMLADNDEAKVHSDVQCDGTDSCNCPMCREKKLNDSELAVGDTFKEAFDFLDAPDVTDPVMEGADADEDLESEESIEDAADVSKEADTKTEKPKDECGAVEKNTLEESMSFLSDEEEELVDPEEDMEDIAVGLSAREDI